MPTGLKKLGFANRQLLGKEDFETRLFGYLNDSNKRLAQIMCVEDIVLNGSLTLDADGTDAFKIEKTGVAAGVDSNGETLDIEDSDIASYLATVPFPNAVGNNYYVGLKHVQIPSVLAINPRTGSPDWTEFQDFIGYLKAPTAVVDNGDGTLTATLDPEITAALDCTGRSAFIYQGSPADGALNLATALEECTVALNGVNNEITTAGSLGQTVISTTLSDYTIILIGPFVTISSGVATASGIVHIGRITGNGPAAVPVTFDYTLQRNAVSLSTVLSDGFSADLLPSVDNTYDLGSAVYRWKDLYVANLNVNNLLPALHNTYDLGENATRWQDLYLSGTIYSAGSWEGHILPTSDNTYDLGGVGVEWRDIFIDGTANIDKLIVDIEVGSDLIPDTNNTYDLGAGAAGWKDLYVKGTAEINAIVVNDYIAVSRLSVSSSAGLGVYNHLVPDVEDSYDIGSSLRYWRALYVKNTSVLSLRGGTVPENLSSVDLASQKIFYNGGNVRPWDTTNTVDTGDTTSDFCTAFPLGISNPVIYAVNSTLNNSISVIKQTATGITTSNTSIAGFIEAGAWRLDAICSDGVSLYVHATKTDAPDQYVHKIFALSLHATTGAPNGVKSGWNVGGVGTLTGGGSAGNIDASEFDQGLPYKIIYGMNGRVVCVNPWILSTASATLELITIVSATDGTLSGEHSGQTAPAADYYYTGALASDGTNIYFCAIEKAGSDTINIFRTSMSGIVAGSPTNEETVYTSTTVSDYCSNMVWDGGTLWIAMRNHVFAHQPGAVAYQAILPSTAFEPKSICFDGKNIWFAGCQLVEANRWHMVLLKVSAAKVYQNNGTVFIPEDDRYFLTSPDEMEATDLWGINTGRLLFDGINIWSILNEAGTAPFAGGTIRRLPKVSML